jgi:hypothetical protein
MPRIGDLSQSITMLEQRWGGSYDNNQFNILLEHYISSYKWIGAILLVAGLVFLFINIEKILLIKTTKRVDDSTEGRV